MRTKAVSASTSEIVFLSHRFELRRDNPAQQSRPCVHVGQIYVHLVAPERETAYWRYQRGS